MTTFLICIFGGFRAAGSLANISSRPTHYTKVRRFQFLTHFEVEDQCPKALIPVLKKNMMTVVCMYSNQRHLSNVAIITIS